MVLYPNKLPESERVCSGICRRKEVISLIESSKLKAIFSVNAELLALYWKIGNDILIKQREQGWGTKVIRQLSKGLAKRF